MRESEKLIATIDATTKSEIDFTVRRLTKII
jgi:hypothetical protein